MPWCAGRAVAPLEAHHAAKSFPVAQVGRPGRQRLLCLCKAHGRVDLGRGQDAGERGVDGDQVVHQRRPFGRNFTSPPPDRTLHHRLTSVWTLSTPSTSVSASSAAR